MMSGLVDRLRVELMNLTHWRLRARAPPERKESGWIGGSVIGLLDGFKQMVVGVEEYEEVGPGLFTGCVALRETQQMKHICALHIFAPS